MRSLPACRAGELVAFPTETVYGLGADATNSDAVLKIYETKGRPRFNPLIVHVADLEMAEKLVEFSPLARKLAAFWPGPLTLVLPRKPDAGLSDIVTAGLDTVGIRIPDHPLAQALIRAAGRPLAAPSANRSGKLSPTTAAQVRRSLGDAVPVLDGGPAQSGVEIHHPRGGGRQRSPNSAPAPCRATKSKPPSARRWRWPRTTRKSAPPGMLLSHYAPECDPTAGCRCASAGRDVARLRPGPGRRKPVADRRPARGRAKPVLAAAPAR